MIKCPKYSHLTLKESIAECTKKGVTNGYGQGNGLYHTTEFIKRNKGDLTLHSGCYTYKITNGNVSVSESGFWGGTYIYMRVNLKHEVDYNSIFGIDNTLVDNFNFYYNK